MNLSHLINRNLKPMTPALINFQPLPMKYSNYLTKSMNLEVFFQIYRGCLTKFGIFKLKQNGISGKSLNLLCDFLRNRKQRVLLYGQVSVWANVKAGVCQGLVLILGPLLLLIFISYLSECLSLNAKLFADDKLLIRPIPLLLN